MVFVLGVMLMRGEGCFMNVALCSNDTSERTAISRQLKAQDI